MTYNLISLKNNYKHILDMKFYKYLLSFFHITNALINFRGGNLPREYPFHTIEMAPYHPKIHGYSNIGFLGDVCKRCSNRN